MKRMNCLLVFLVMFGILLVACGGGGPKCVNCATETPQPSVAEQYETLEVEATREAAVIEAAEEFAAKEAAENRALIEELDQIIQEEFEFADPCGLSTQDCPND